VRGSDLAITAISIALSVIDKGVVITAGLGLEEVLSVGVEQASWLQCR
jgi:hypothetical protein